MSATSAAASNLIDSGAAEGDPVQAHPLPAWLLSFMLHFGVVISGALLLRAGTLTSAGEGIGERGGEIVLFSNSSSNDKSYLTSEDVGGGAEVESSEAAMESTSDAIPSADSAPMIPGVGLPKAVGGSGAKTQATTSAASAANAMSRLGPKGGKGGSAATSVFGAIGEGQRFVYVFDRSSSMQGPALNAAKRELLASLAHLGDIHQFGIVFYNHNQSVFGNSSASGVRLYFAKKDNRLLAEQFVSGTSAQGATSHLPALKLALEARPDVVFFLTDADDPVLTASELQKVRSYNVGATINAIQFGYGPQQSSDNFLEQLTSENGGVYRYIDVTQLPKVK